MEAHSQSLDRTCLKWLSVEKKLNTDSGRVQNRRAAWSQEVEGPPQGKTGPRHQISIHPQSTGLGLKDVPDLLPKHRPPPHPADMAENTHTHTHTCMHTHTNTHTLV